MKVGYPCINLSLPCRSSHRFRLASFSRERFLQTVSANLDCLQQILEFNAENGLLYFRISSDLIPFASHPVCTVPWQTIFAARFAAIGRFIRGRRMRITMHPDQFILLTAHEEWIVAASIAELEYHAQVLELLELDQTARIQIHIGAAYGDRPASLDRFSRCWLRLSEKVRRRLAVENDDRLFNLADALEINHRTGAPVLFDTFHHELFNRGEPLREAFLQAAATWRKKDGVPLVDYSSQQSQARRGSHGATLDARHFRLTTAQLRGMDYDLMLEIKDKEKSALQAKAILAKRRNRPVSKVP